MKKLILGIALLFYVFISDAQNPSFQWAKSLGGSGGSISPFAFTSDTIGNLYTTGSFGNVIDFDPGPDTYTLSSYASGLDVFISKLDASGNFIWAKAICSVSNNSVSIQSMSAGKAIIVDINGNVYVTGSYGGTVDFDPGLGTYYLTDSSSSNNTFIVKLDSFGNFIWARNFKGQGNGASAITVDFFGNVITTGGFNGTVDFDPGTNNYSLTSSLGSSFVSKLDASGNFIWAKGITGGTSQGTSLKVDVFGNVFSSGYFQFTPDFDPGIGSYTITAFGGVSRFDAFILKLDASGSFIWAKQIGGTENDFAFSTVLDDFGNIYTAGIFKGSADFDPGVNVNNLTAVSIGDLFILKLDALGNFVWSKNVPVDVSTSSMLGTFYLALDTSFNVYVSGYYNGIVDFDPAITNSFLNSGAYSNVFISEFDSSGSFKWVKGFGSSGEAIAEGIAIDNKNNIYIGGRFSGTVNSYPDTLSLSIISQSSQDAFVCKITPCMSPMAPINATPLANLTICENSTSLLSATTMGTVNWFATLASTVCLGTGTNFLTPILTAGTYTYYAEANTCTVSASRTAITITVNANPIITVSNESICLGSSAVLIASGATTYTWSNGVTTFSISDSPITTTIYSVSGTGINSCSTTQTVSITVDNTCADVWPGDANSDGIADNLDVLELGLHYTQTGMSRASISYLWQSYFSNNWTGTITNGKNLKHSDCNGDGIIDDNDTLAIYNNYGLTHAFRTAQTNTVNPQLSIVPDQGSVANGLWGTASVYLGNAANQLNNINGVAFTVDFDNTLVESNNIYIEYQNSFLNSSNQNLQFRKLDFANGKIFTATTHTNNINVSGFGKIATLHYQIKSSLTVNDTLILSLALANQSNATGNIIPLTSGSSSITVLAVGIEELKNNNFISINPNPTNDFLTVNSKTDLQKIEVVTITGQVLLSEIPASINHTFHLANFANGIYFVNMYQNNGIIKREKVVLNK